MTKAGVTRFRDKWYIFVNDDILLDTSYSTEEYAEKCLEEMKLEGLRIMVSKSKPCVNV